jgi:cobalt/nickel transport system permease protein
VHIPDGFIAPVVYGPAYGAAGVLWAVGLRRLRRVLDPAAIPRLAVATAAAFALMMVTVPLPGGTTVHVSGVGMIAVLFGVWNGFLALSLVFLLQALMFGDGGVTALPINALAMGLCGSLAAVGTWRLLRRVHRTAAVFCAGWTGTVIPAIIVAVVLGAQPVIASGSDGQPLFFPFGWDVTLPAVIIPHLLVGIADGVLAVLAWRMLKPREVSP